MINPSGDGQIKIAFSSGNMTSGIVLHHENWHFITPENDSYFAKVHTECLRGGLLDATAPRSKQAYGAYIKNCRQKLETAGLKEESDIKAFFVPGEGGRATEFINRGIRNAQAIWLAAHRFSYNRLLEELRSALGSSTAPQMRLVFDDDTWWAGQGEQVGDNEAWEYTNAKSLIDRGAEARWMETNHNAHLLHHNKYIVFESKASAVPSGVFCGAGNFTGTGFSSNFENFYWIEIPAVWEAYRKQYEYKWTKLATPTDNLPRENALPPGS